MPPSTGEELLESFWVKGSRALEKGRTEAPYAWVFPPEQRDPGAPGPPGQPAPRAPHRGPPPDRRPDARRARPGRPAATWCAWTSRTATRRSTSSRSRSSPPTSRTRPTTTWPGPGRCSTASRARGRRPQACSTRPWSRSPADGARCAGGWTGTGDVFLLRDTGQTSLLRARLLLGEPPGGRGRGGVRGGRRQLSRRELDRAGAARGGGARWRPRLGLDVHGRRVHAGRAAPRGRPAAARPCCTPGPPPRTPAGRATRWTARAAVHPGRRRRPAARRPRRALRRDPLPRQACGDFARPGARDRSQVRSARLHEDRRVPEPRHPRRLATTSPAAWASRGCSTCSASCSGAACWWRSATPACWRSRAAWCAGSARRRRAPTPRARSCAPRCCGRSTRSSTATRSCPASSAATVRSGTWTTATAAGAVLQFGTKQVPEEEEKKEEPAEETIEVEDVDVEGSQEPKPAAPRSRRPGEARRTSALVLSGFVQGEDAGGRQARHPRRAGGEGAGGPLRLQPAPPVSQPVGLPASSTTRC